MKVLVYGLAGFALLLASCGDDPTPAVEVPPWAKVAPEQIAEAKKFGVPVAFENGIGMRFVLIPAGTFLMGSPEDEARRNLNETQHEVTITRPFYVSIHEVTNAQYRKFRPDHVSWFRGDGPQQPAAPVSWDDAKACASWLTGRGADRRYRLPTEAEWEYACRAGTKTPFSTGDTISTELANYNGHWSYPQGRCGGGLFRKQPVDGGTFPPNRWGLYDLHGNVWEWCEDRVGQYPEGSVTDPRGPTSGEGRIRRGGCWRDWPWRLRSAHRWTDQPVTRISALALGFRLVSPLPERAE